ncbi:hypothetical protein Sjap_015095 [Stephania japonica]|uniref:Uncharacterized protein n=1 Tax=Stephania japonica TaxID=461633 RepID=A0AAP0IJJ9_9MAGN
MWSTSFWGGVLVQPPPPPPQAPLAAPAKEPQHNNTSTQSKSIPIDAPPLPLDARLHKRMHDNEYHCKNMKKTK